MKNLLSIINRAQRGEVIGRRWSACGTILLAAELSESNNAPSEGARGASGPRRQPM